MLMLVCCCSLGMSTLFGQCAAPAGCDAACPSVCVTDATLAGIAPGLCLGGTTQLLCLDWNGAGDPATIVVDYTLTPPLGETVALVPNAAGDQVCIEITTPPAATCDITETQLAINAITPAGGCTLGYDLLLSQPLAIDEEGCDINTGTISPFPIISLDLLPTLNSQLPPLVVFPTYDVVIVPPGCDGATTGSATLEVNGTQCDQVLGTAGTENACPDLVDVDGDLTYDFSTFAIGTGSDGTAYTITEAAAGGCVNGAIADVVTVDCLVACAACEITDVQAGAPVCNPDGSYTVEVTVTGTDASVTLDDAGSAEGSQAAAGAVTFTYTAGTDANITVVDADGVCTFGPFAVADPGCPVGPVCNAVLANPGVSIAATCDGGIPTVVFDGTCALEGPFVQTGGGAGVGCVEADLVFFGTIDAFDGADPATANLLAFGDCAGYDLDPALFPNATCDPIDYEVFFVAGLDVFCLDFTDPDNPVVGDYITTIYEDCEVFSTTYTVYPILTATDATADAITCGTLQVDLLASDGSVCDSQTQACVADGDVLNADFSGTVTDPQACSTLTAASAACGGCTVPCTAAAGTLTTTTDPLTVCALDGNADVIDVETTGEAGQNTGWLITDAATGEILSAGVVSPGTTTFSPDLEGAPVGTCSIWLISWDGNLTDANSGVAPAQGDNAADLTSDVCLVLSNSIDVVREDCTPVACTAGFGFSNLENCESGTFDITNPNGDELAPSGNELIYLFLYASSDGTVAGTNGASFAGADPAADPNAVYFGENVGGPNSPFGVPNVINFVPFGFGGCSASALEIAVVAFEITNPVDGTIAPVLDENGVSCNQIITYTEYPELVATDVTPDAATCGTLQVDLLASDGSVCDSQTQACVADGDALNADFSATITDPQGCSTLTATSAACAGCAAPVLTCENPNGCANTLVDGSFDAGIADFTTFGNAFASDAAGGEPEGMIKLFGNFSGGFDVTGAFFEYPACEGNEYELSACGLHTSGDAISGVGAPDDNWVVIKIAYFDAGGNEIGACEATILDGNSPTDVAITASTSCAAPVGTESVQALILYLQPGNDGGAAYVDNLSFCETVNNCSTADPVTLGLADPCDCATSMEVAPGVIIAQETLTITPGGAPYDVTAISDVYGMDGVALTDVELEALIAAADPGDGSAFDVNFWVLADGVTLFSVSITDGNGESATQTADTACTPCPCPTVAPSFTDSACNGDAAININVDGYSDDPNLPYNYEVAAGGDIEFVDNGDGTLTFDPSSLAVASATTYEVVVNLSYSNGTCPATTTYQVTVDECGSCAGTCSPAAWSFGFAEPEMCSTDSPICFDFSDYVGSEMLMGNVTSANGLAGQAQQVSVCFDYDDDAANGPGSSNLLDLTSLDGLNLSINYAGTTTVAEGDYDTIGVTLTVGTYTQQIFTCNDPGAGNSNVGPDADCPDNDHFTNIAFSADVADLAANIPTNTDCSDCPAGDPICVNYYLQSNSLDWTISLNADMSFQYNNLSAGVDDPFAGNLNDEAPDFSNLPSAAFSVDVLTGEYCVNPIFTLDADEDTDGDGAIDWPGGVTYDLADYDEVQICFTGGSCKEQYAPCADSADGCGTVCTETQCQTILFLETVYCDLDANGGFACGDEDYDLEQLFTDATTQGGNFSVDGADATLNGNYVDVSELTFTDGVASILVTYSRTEGNKCDSFQGAECTTTLTIYEPISVESWNAPSVVCEDAAMIALPAPGAWSGAGVSDDGAGNYSFSPMGLGGQIATLTWEASNNLCGFSESYAVNVESSFDVTIGNNPSGAVCLDAVQSLGVVDFNAFLTGETSGAGYWSYSYEGADPVAFGSVLDLGANAAVGNWTFTYTIPGNGNCGSADSFSISVDTGCTEGLTLTDSVICADASGTFDLTPYLDFALEGDVAAEASILTGVCDNVVFPAPPALGGDLPYGSDDVTVCPVAPGEGTLSIAIPSVPSYGVINTFDITFSYFGTRDGADGDLDTISLFFGAQEIFAFDNAEINAFFGSADNHFGEITISFVPQFGADGYPESYTAFAGEGTFNSEDIVLGADAFDVCNLDDAISYYLYSNSAYWDAELSVAATWYAQIEEIFGAANLHETGTELPLGANPCGGFSIATLEDGSPALPVQVLFTSEGCGEYDEVDINLEVNCTCNDDYACLATGSATIVFLETYASTLKDMELCMPQPEVDLTQLFDGADQGGTFTSDLGTVMGDILMPAGPGAYNITYCINAESACNDAAEDGCSTAVLTINDARFTALASACTGVTAGDIVTANVDGGSWTANGGAIDPTTVIDAAGTYTIEYTVGGCTESAEVVVYDSVDPIPAIDDVTVCEGDVVDLNALLPEGVVANWTGFNVINGSFYSSALGGFVFQFDGMVGTEECGQSTSVMVTVDAAPDASFTVPSVLCNDDAAINLADYATTGGSFAVNGEAATEFVPADNPGVNTITYSVSAGSCTNAETATITVLGSDPVKFEVVDGEYTRCLDADGAFELSLDGDADGIGTWIINCAIDGALDNASIDGAAGAFTFNYDIGVVNQHGVVPYTITYDMPGSCSNSFTQTVTIYDIPANNNAFEGMEICEGEEIPTIEGITGGAIDSYYITDADGNVIYESANVFFDNEMSWTPESLGVGETTFNLYIENQYGCSSDAAVISYTVNALPTLTWDFGCTDPVADENGNYAAALVFDASMVSGDYVITIADSEGNETTGGMNDALFVINAGEVYSASVTDGNGCTSAAIEGIRAEYAVEFATSVDACSEDGFVTVTVEVDENTGYGSPYSYSFDGGLSFGAENVATLPVAANPTISILVRDDKGCLSAFDIIEVGTVSEFIPTAGCADADGNVTVDFNYVGADYTAVVSVGGVDVATLPEGTDYVVNVTDAADVTITVTANSGDVSCSATGTVTVYPAVVTEASSPVCEGDDVAFVTSGGNGVYDLTIYPFGGEEGINIGAVGGTQLIGELPAGAHTYTIVSGGCSADGAFEILPAAGEVTLVYDSSFDSALTVCGDDDLTVTVTGGSVYEWTDDAGNTLAETGNTITIPVTSATGTYTVQAVDNGCPGEPYEITPIYNEALSTTDPAYTCNEDGTATVSFVVNGGLATESQVLVNGVLVDRAVTVQLGLGESQTLTISSNGSSCDPITVDIENTCEPTPEPSGCAPLLVTPLGADCAEGFVTVQIAGVGGEFTVTGVVGNATLVGEPFIQEGEVGTADLTFQVDENLLAQFTILFDTDCGSYEQPISIDCSNPTAIELIEFDGTARENGNLLTWTTATEHDNDFFTLERSTDGVNFTAVVAKVEGAGNSNVPTSYEVLDTEAPEGTSFYRLLATDIEGVTVIAADVIDVTRRAEGTIAVSPVPASDYINVLIDMPGDVELNVYDVTGQLVEVIYANGDEVRIELGGYASGNYFLTANNGLEMITTKFIVK